MADELERRLERALAQGDAAAGEALRTARYRAGGITALEEFCREVSGYRLRGAVAPVSAPGVVVSWVMPTFKHPRGHWYAAVHLHRTDAREASGRVVVCSAASPDGADAALALLRAAFCAARDAERSQIRRRRFSDR